MKDFRSDINGLRAWAVLAVVLFHFSVPGFAGGFVGVDVFFVISGFLMTRIIVEGLTAPTASENPARAFTLLGFYLARGRRILPALMVLCVFLLVAGWFVLGAAHYQMLATHSQAAITFISNITFWQEAGYFDTASHEKWLLHTWSLSVEWQFYLLFPLVLMVLWKLWPNRRFLGIALIVSLLASLALNLWLTPINPSKAFYLFPGRAWEMLAGGLVYFYGSHLVLTANQRRGLEWLGFALIAACIGLLSGASVWPGTLAIIPVLGAVLVLLAARQHSYLSTIAPLQWIGKTSYSIYLWHWPFSVALIYVEWRDQWLAVLGAIALTLLCGWLSWRWIEQAVSKLLLSNGLVKNSPVQNSPVQNSRWRELAIIVVAVVLLVLPMQWIQLHKGVPGRLDPRIDQMFAEAQNVNPRRGECHVSDAVRAPQCQYGGQDLGIIVLGDSHAQALIRSVEKALPSPQLHVLDWTLSGCPTIIGIKNAESQTYSCAEFINTSLARSAELPAHIPLLIINRLAGTFEGQNEADRTDKLEGPKLYISAAYATRTEAYYAEIEQGVVDTACAFAKQRPVYMLRPVPELMVDVPRIMGRALMRGQERRISIDTADYEQRTRRARHAQERAVKECGVVLLDPLPYLCHDGRCWGDVAGLPSYSDDDHLNERGGALLIPLFQQMFQQIFR